MLADLFARMDLMERRGSGLRKIIEAYEFEEIDAHPREVGSGHVRVEIKAFSVNPYDVALRLGEMKEIRTLETSLILP